MCLSPFRSPGAGAVDALSYQTWAQILAERDRIELVYAPGCENAVVSICREILGDGCQVEYGVGCTNSVTRIDLSICRGDRVFAPHASIRTTSPRSSTGRASRPAPGTTAVSRWWPG